MSELLKDQVDVGDLVDRYKTLREEIEQRLAGVHGAGDAKQIERLQREIRSHGELVTKTLNAMDKRPCNEVGDTVDVVRYEYDERGTWPQSEYCRDSTNGTARIYRVSARGMLESRLMVPAAIRNGTGKISSHYVARRKLI